VHLGVIICNNLGLDPIICYPLVDCLVAPATCGAIADCLRILVALSLSCSHLTIASPSPCRRLAPPFTRHRHQHVRSQRCTRTATATAIAIGIVGHYPYRCCCHHQCPSSRQCLRCLRRRCPDVSVAPDALVAPPLPLSFVMDPTAVRLRIVTVPRWRRRRQRRRRRSATDATAPTPDAA